MTRPINQATQDALALIAQGTPVARAAAKYGLTPAWLHRVVRRTRARCPECGQVIGKLAVAARTAKRV